GKIFIFLGSLRILWQIIETIILNRRVVMSQTETRQEISDLIVAFDETTLARKPVLKREVVEYFSAARNFRAARIVERIPEKDGFLDPAAVDRLLIRAHTELQRLSEEFEHGRRVAELLHPLLDAFRREGVERPFRVVDVGCGTGCVLRWLAAGGNLGDDVELIGADYNQALVEEARRLALLERLRVTFVTANAFKLAQTGSIYLTTGVLHHFNGEGLAEFFSAQDRAGASAFIHFDF